MSMHLLIQFRKPVTLIIMSLLAYIASPQTVRAVSPPPDGGYGPPAYGTGNTAEGEDALLNLSSGAFNTATGFEHITVTAAASTPPLARERFSATPLIKIRQWARGAS